MFNTAEIDIFRKTGLNPVFFGETLTGDKMPNLTYMLVFNNMDERQANWKRFGGSPEWKALRAIPEYADKKILCGITNLYLKPADYSQI
jgi:NIPSNAP protein